MSAGKLIHRLTTAVLKIFA